MPRLLMTSRSSLPLENTATNSKSNNARSKSLLSTITRQFIASLCLLLMGAVMHAVVMDRMSDADWFLTHSQSDHSGSVAANTAANTGSNIMNSESTPPSSSTITTPSTSTNNLQFDMVLPLFERDENVRAFATRLKPTLQQYQEMTANNTTKITTFRLLLTRYSKAEIDRIPQLKKELSELSSIPHNHILLIPVADQPFHRSSACNILMQQAACHETHCFVARVDVDMDLKPEFFVHSQNYVQPDKTAYFPIVWSEYNPQSVQLVQEYMNFHAQQQQKTTTKPQPLPKYSEHRGHWRIWGTGMYVLSGPDAAQFRFSEEFKGWGGEDGNFYERVKAQRKIIRKEETGLIHTWHPKNCRQGKDVFTELQIKECHTTRAGEDGSELGKKLLQKWKQTNNIKDED